MDREGAAQAVEAAQVNDPYLPRPLREASEEKEVWAAFVVSYLETAKMILLEEGEDVLDLPLMFIQGLVDMERERQQGQRQAAVRVSKGMGEEGEEEQE
jgi:hypothetical protein